MADHFLWFPANGGTTAPIGFGPSPFRVVGFAGLGNTRSSPLTQKAPFQAGESLLDSDVGPKVIAISLRIVAADKEERWRLRSQLSRAMSVEPVAQAARGPKIGLLRLVRDAFPTVEIEAVPRESPQFSELIGQDRVVDADLEFFCPSPFWRDPQDSFATFNTEGGFVFPLAYPLEMPLGTATIDIHNKGDVSTPFLLRVFGELTTFRIRNLTSGEVLEVTGTIPAGERIEVNTAFGNKTVFRYDAGENRFNEMDRLSIGVSTFWQLLPGTNTVRFEADANVSGSAQIFWRNRYAGV